MRQQSTVRHVAAHGHIILIWSLQNFVVFGLTRPGLELTMYYISGENANHYTTDVVKGKFLLSCI